MSSTKSLPAPGKNGAANRPPLEKAAAVLALLDEKTLAQLQGRVADKHREKLLTAVKTMRSIPQPELRRIAQEFAQRISVEKTAVRGSEEAATRVASNLFEDEEPVEEVEAQSADLDEMLAQLDQTPFWERIGKLPLKKLITYFEDKSASVLGIAMQCLPADVGSELAGEIDDGLVREAILLIATTGTPNPLAVEAVEKMLDAALLAKAATGDAAADDDEGNPNADTVAGILNRLTNKRREKVLETLKNTLSPDEMAEIASKVLSFEALEYRLPRNAIPVIFREVAENDVLVALKYALAQKDPVADYLLGNISQRLAAGYRERMEAMPEVDEETGEKAQSAVICKLLAIVDQGRIDLLAPEDQQERSQKLED